MRLTILTTSMDCRPKGLHEAGSVMKWKGCHIENRKLVLEVVFCRQRLRESESRSEPPGGLS